MSPGLVEWGPGMFSTAGATASSGVPGARRATVAMAAMKDLDLAHDRVNVNGGACAMGHPVGATGARLVTTLANEMKRRGSRLGLVSVCAQGGMGFAMVLER